jgi:hypothetical protein
MLKKLIVLSLIFMGLGFGAYAQKSVRVINNNSFDYGEKITYKVKYNLYFNVSVGEINFQIDNKPGVVAGNNCYHITCEGKTFGFYDPFYKVFDHYESYLETNSLLPLVYIRNIHEGKFAFNEYVVFNHTKSLAKSQKRTQKVPKFTMDVLSTIYFSRTFDYDNASIGKKYYFTTFIDDSAYNVGVKYMGKETIKTSLGSVRCVKIKPILVVDRIFKSSDDMTLWVTDDNNHIPVRIESGISVGKIVVDLDSWSGLKNPMTALK